MQQSLEAMWYNFQKSQQLSEEQRIQFEKYAEALIEFNRVHNITAVTTPARVVIRHFEDSLALDKAYDVATVGTLCDVGTGGGFPAVPLKIKYPGLKVVLIEVNHKKITFLTELCERLGLVDVVIDDRDWRTFLRPTQEGGHSIDLFVSRASLAPEELMRMYRPACRYRNVPLVYWASKQWKPDQKIASHVTRTYDYSCGTIARKLIFFMAPL